MLVINVIIYLDKLTVVLKMSNYKLRSYVTITKYNYFISINHTR